VAEDRERSIYVSIANGSRRFSLGKGRLLVLDLEVERYRMRCLLLLFRGLVLFPQLFYGQPYPFGPGIRRLILAAIIKIIPEPLPILREAGCGNRPFFQGGVILGQYIIPDNDHGMLCNQKSIIKSCRCVKLFYRRLDTVGKIVIKYTKYSITGWAY